MNDHTAYQHVPLNKSMYKNSDASFSAQLELLDPSENYTETELASLDAYQRQLKRFEIRVSGAQSSKVEKFFSTADSAALFPEYVSRAVKLGMDENEVIASIVASKTMVNSPDYRSITTDFDSADIANLTVAEGAQIPVCDISLNETLVHLVKRGRILQASYEALRYQKLDLFTVALRQIGSYIAKAQLSDAVSVLTGDPTNTADTTAATVINTAATTLAYSDLIALWSAFNDFQMNTLLASPDMAAAILSLDEFKDPAAGLQFQATGKLGTPLGAVLIKSAAVPTGTVIALDKRYALEMAVAADISVDYDKLIDTQLERAAITSVAGFAKIFPDAVKVLKLTVSTPSAG